MSIEAMKQALEALENCTTWSLTREQFDKNVTAITALRTAIEQAEKQEPVAWMYWQSCLNDDGTQTAPWVQRYSKFKPPESVINKEITPLYTTPPAAQRQPLTDEEIDDIWNRYCDEMGEASINDAYDIVRAIEQAHGITGEKNHGQR